MTGHATVSVHKFMHGWAELHLGGMKKERTMR